MKSAEQLRKENEQLREKIAQMEQEVWALDSKLNFVYSSRPYKVAMLLKNGFDKLVPANSIRYRAAKQAWKVLKKILKKQDGKLALTGVQMESLDALGKYERMDVVTTKHTMYIAKLIKRELDELDIGCRIHIGEPQDYENIPYVIICPQFVKHFPKVYFAFQMEQTISSRWFTQDYLTILRNSCGVLDYSLTNIDFYQKPDYRDLSKKAYYLPIDYHPSYTSVAIPEAKEYDVIFYGDTNNPRRKAILEAVSKRFKVKLCSELYGEDVYREIRKAKVLLNIHYYEGALLETTRLYETLSLNSCVIISEDSRHTTETDRLLPFVDFVPEDDTEALIERIAYWLEHEEERRNKVNANQAQLESRCNAFRFYFLRFLLAHDRIDFETFYHLAGEYVQLGTEKLCLNLPESTQRRRSFDRDNCYGFVCVPGLRHLKGWVGCGMSYKLIFRRALEEKLDRIMICEDDVLFPENFEVKLAEIEERLDKQENWDIFSGVMADVGNTQILSCQKSGEQMFVGVDRMISMVFNMYNRNMFEILAAWDEQNRDVERNAIDRYLEDKKINVYVQVPFLVGHKEEMNSTIWSISNMQYAQLIANSEEKLRNMIRVHCDEEKK